MQAPNSSHGQPPTPNGLPRPLMSPLGPPSNSPMYGGMHHGMGGPAPGPSIYNTPNGPADAMRYSDPMSDIVHTPSSHQSHGSHHSIASMAAQKRAYRQRRKDPSCDACRERKVKCDATDASSCSECTSRQVKCQFTKETNRRMSSMKQVQDLERQLHQARQQINQMKGMLQDSPTSSAPFQSHLSSNLSDNPQARDRGQPSRAASNFFKVRRNIRNYGRGVFKPPQPYRTPANPPLYVDDGLQLPNQHDTNHLLSQYKAALHSYQPILHWPTFLSEVDDVYRNATFRGVRKLWVGVFFAVLACGALVSDDQSLQESAERHMQSSTTLVNSNDDEFTMDHPRIAFLASFYYMETNRRSLASIWLGSAVRCAQEAGLHVNLPALPFMQMELRRRIWWSIHHWDRLSSLELGCLHDGFDPDVEVSEPTPVDDSLIKQDGFQRLEHGNSPPNILLPLIPAIRLTYQLQKTLKSRVISAATLKIYDDHFQSIMESYPDPFALASMNPLDPYLLHSVCVVQICRFMLYRHNLSPHCRPQEREDAVLRTVQVAKDTAHYVWRTTPAAFSRGQQAALHPADVHNPEWLERMKFAIPAVTVKHYWRCILILCHVGEFGIAQTLVGSMAAIGSRRKANIACARYLTFYLDLLLQRWQAGRSSEIEGDEEMIAYASGDLQGSSHAAWAWTGSGGATSSLQSQDSSGSSPGPRTGSPEQSFTQEPTPATSTTSAQAPPFLLTPDEEEEWGSWVQIEDMLRQLQRLHSASAAQPGSRQRSSSHYSSPDDTRVPHAMSGINHPPQQSYYAGSAGVPHIPRSSPGSGSITSLPPLISTQQQHSNAPTYHYPGPPSSTYSVATPSGMTRPPSQHGVPYHGPSSLGSPSSVSNASASNGGTNNPSAGPPPPQQQQQRQQSQTPVTRISINDII